MEAQSVRLTKQGESHDDDEQSGRRMRFWDHVYEVRRRILLVVSSILVLAAGGYLIVPQLVEAIGQVVDEELFATSITEGFMIRVKVSFLLGILGSLPLLAIQILLFVAPAVTVGSRVAAGAALLVALGLAVGGVVFALDAVLPISLAFLRSEAFFPAHVGRLLSYGTFLGFFFQFLIGFGLFFEFPVLLICLLRLGVVTRAYLMANFKYFVGVIFALAAVVTPPDVVSQALLAAPMTVLYLLTVWSAWMFNVG
jgi:sec-independent protein translocase protein TatC